MKGISAHVDAYKRDSYHHDESGGKVRGYMVNKLYSYKIERKDNQLTKY
jgi:hypothetical protein